MELKDYTVKSIHHVPYEPPIKLREFQHTRTRYTSSSTAVIAYNLPFVYNEFKLMCLLAIFRSEGVSFQQMASVSSTCQHCYHYKGILTGHREILRNGQVSIIEMTILITETEIHEIPKFTVASA